MESLICVSSSLVTGSCVNPRSLSILLRGVKNLGDRILELLRHCSVEDRLANVVSEVKWANEQDVDSLNFGDGLHVFQSLLGLNLHNSHDRVVGLLFMKVSSRPTAASKNAKVREIATYGDIVSSI